MKTRTVENIIHCIFFSTQTHNHYNIIVKVLNSETSKTLLHTCKLYSHTDTFNPKHCKLVVSGYLVNVEKENRIKI